MPPQKDVPSLLSLCGKSVEDALVNRSENFLINEEVSLDDYLSWIESCKMQLCKLPSLFHNMLAEHCLKAGDRIAVHCSSMLPQKLLKSQIAVQYLVSIVTHLKVKEVYFHKWSKPVQASLLNFLWKMTHLEILQYNHPRNYLEFSFSEEIQMKNWKKLEESLPFLTNLTKFSGHDCTDKIIAIVCENCERLEKINVYGKKVTNKSLDSLVHCTELREVSLPSRQVTAEGFLKLLLNTRSKNLVKIGDLASHFGDLLQILETDLVPFRTFQTQQINFSEIFDGTYLPLIAKYFPCITRLDIFQGVEGLQHFSCLDNLKLVKKVKLLLCVYPAYPFEHFYALKSEVLTSLCLGSGSHSCIGERISISGLINVGLQCPNLEKLALEGDCSFVKDVDFSTARLLGSPFRKLKKFRFFSGTTSAFDVELILILATNIEHIEISGISSRSVTDKTFTNILKFNALTDLRSLRIHPGNLSLNLIKSIVLNCKKINSLRGFVPFYDGALSKEEFESLQKFITENNYHIDFQ